MISLARNNQSTISSSARKGFTHSLARKGFTLIELLVVIAIIGILSAVVLASFNTARTKSNDASVKANLNTVRTQSVLYYDANNGYSNAAVTAISPATAAACTTASTVFTDPRVADAIAAANYSGAVLKCGFTVNASNIISAWAVHGTISNGGIEWCVDSTGVSKVEPSAGTGTSCP